MSNSQIKECLRLVTAGENLKCSEVLQSYRKETSLEFSPNWQISSKHYMTFPTVNCEAERTSWNQYRTILSKPARDKMGLSPPGRTISKLLLWRSDPKSTRLPQNRKKYFGHLLGRGENIVPFFWIWWCFCQHFLDLKFTVISFLILP